MKTTAIYKTWRIILFSLQLVCGSWAYAQEIPPDLAVKIIVSEAANQDFKGMVCVAEVLRHRGSTKGFYGYRSNRINKK